MQAHIFAEAANTTANSPELPIKEYYEGIFGVIAGLNDELEEFAETSLHVFSDEYGVVDGQDQMSDIRVNRDLPVGTNEMIRMAKKELIHASDTADVMIILLSTDVFRATVAQIWEDLVSEANPDSVWCIGAARSALNELRLTGLDTKGCFVLTYHRVGVAPIGTETRKKLLEMVRQKKIQ